jgi:hypothetical protein
LAEGTKTVPKPASAAAREDPGQRSDTAVERQLDLVVGCEHRKRDRQVE